jgi:hypothetical protein
MKITARRATKLLTKPVYFLTLFAHLAFNELFLCGFGELILQLTDDPIFVIILFFQIGNLKLKHSKGLLNLIIVVHKVFSERVDDLLFSRRMIIMGYLRRLFILLTNSMLVSFTFAAGGLFAFLMRISWVMIGFGVEH